MSVIEGGAFICFRHDFMTDSVKTWDRHCYEFGHTQDVTQQCKKCGEWNEEKDRPIPERYIELTHMSPDKLQEQIGRRDVIVLKCKKCEQ